MSALSYGKERLYVPLQHIIKLIWAASGYEAVTFAVISPENSGTWLSGTLEFIPVTSLRVFDHMTSQHHKVISAMRHSPCPAGNVVSIRKFLPCSVRIVTIGEWHESKSDGCILSA
ncbi:putative transcriptional regulatory protein [Fusarium oxysporum f. sp. albedinis]|nr:putative transcriptional regulatory protein [Fusarium oxysporum f. sp. albedinis]